MTEPEAKFKKTPINFSNKFSDDTQIRDGESILVDSIIGDPKRPTLNPQLQQNPKLNLFTPVKDAGKHQSLSQEEFVETIKYRDRFDIKGKHDDDDFNHTLRDANETLTEKMRLQELQDSNLQQISADLNPMVATYSLQQQEHIQKQIKKLQECEKHHCHHCTHFGFFKDQLAQLDGSQHDSTTNLEQAYQVDMGSLKLKDILKFQKRGGCCKVLCVHCRSSHACDQKQKVAIIDYSAGVDIGESFHGQNVQPIELQQSLASLVESSEHSTQVNKFDKIVDLYQQNIGKLDNSRQKRQIKQFGSSMSQEKTSQANSRDFDTNSAMKINLGIDGKASNIVQQFEYKIDTILPQAVKSSNAPFGKHIFEIQDIVVEGTNESHSPLPKSDQKKKILASKHFSGNSSPKSSRPFMVKIENDNSGPNSPNMQTENASSLQLQGKYIIHQTFDKKSLNNILLSSKASQLPAALSQEHSYPSTSHGRYGGRGGQIVSGQSGQIVAGQARQFWNQPPANQPQSPSHLITKTSREDENECSQGQLNLIDEANIASKPMVSKLSKNFELRDDIISNPMLKNSHTIQYTEVDNFQKLSNPQNVQISVKPSAQLSPRGRMTIQETSIKKVIGKGQQSSAGSYNKCHDSHVQSLQSVNSVVQQMNELNELNPSETSNVIALQSNVKTNLMRIDNNIQGLKNTIQAQQKQAMYSSHYGKLKMPFNHYSHPKRDQQQPQNEPSQQKQQKNSRGQPRYNKGKHRSKEAAGEETFYIQAQSTQQAIIASVDEPEVWNGARQISIEDVGQQRGSFDVNRPFDQKMNFPQYADINNLQDLARPEQLRLAQAQYQQNVGKKPDKENSMTTSERFQNRMIQSKISERMEESNVLKNSIEQSPKSINNDLNEVMKGEQLKGGKQVVFKTEEDRNSSIGSDKYWKKRKPPPLKVVDDAKRASPLSNRNSRRGASDDPSHDGSNTQNTPIIIASQNQNERSGDVSFSMLSPSPIKLNSTFFFGTKMNEPQNQNDEFMQTLKLSQHTLAGSKGDANPFMLRNRTTGSNHSSKKSSAERMTDKKLQLKREQEDQTDKLVKHLKNNIDWRQLNKQRNNSPNQKMNIIEQRTDLPRYSEEEVVLLPEIQESGHVTLKKVFDHPMDKQLNTHRAIVNFKTDEPHSRNQQLRGQRLESYDQAPSRQSRLDPQTHSPKPIHEGQIQNEALALIQKKVQRPGGLLEIQGQKKELNQNYISLQLNLLNQIQPENGPDGKQARHSIQTKLNKDLSRAFNISQRNTDTNNVRLQTDFTPLSNLHSPFSGNNASSIFARNSVSGGSPKSQDGDDYLTVEDRLNQFLKQPRYLEYYRNKQRLSTLTQNQQRYNLYNQKKQSVEDIHEERYQLSQHDCLHLGLEIQGNEVKIEDPNILAEKLYKRHQLIRKMDKKDKDFQKMIKQSLAADLRMGSKMECMQTEVPNPRDSQLIDAKQLKTINEYKKQLTYRLNENAQADGIEREQGSLFESKDGIRSSNMSNENSKLSNQYKAINTGTIVRHSGPSSIDSNNPQIEILNDAPAQTGIAVGTDAPGKGGIARPSKFNQFLHSEDLYLIHDFILYYSRNKFKKFKHSNKTLDDDLILNQRDLRDKNLLMDIYYKMRQSQLLDKNHQQIESKINEKMNEIMVDYKQRRKELIKNGDLLVDDEEETDVNKKLLAEESQANSKNENKMKHHGINIRKLVRPQLNTKNLNTQTFQTFETMGSMKGSNRKLKEEDEIVFEDQQIKSGRQLNVKDGTRTLTKKRKFTDSILSSQGIQSQKNSLTGIRLREQQLRDHKSVINSNSSAVMLQKSNTSKVSNTQMASVKNTSVIERSELKFSNQLEFENKDSKMIKRSEIRSAFQKNQFLDQLKHKFLDRNKMQQEYQQSKEVTVQSPSSPSSKEFSMQNGEHMIKEQRVMSLDTDILSPRQVKFIEKFEKIPTFRSKKQTLPTANVATADQLNFNEKSFNVFPDQKLGDYQALPADQKNEPNIFSQFDQGGRNIRKHLNTSQQHQREGLVSHMGNSMGIFYSTSKDGWKQNLMGIPQTIKNSMEDSVGESINQKATITNDLTKGNLSKNTQRSLPKAQHQQLSKQTMAARMAHRTNQDNEDYMEYLSNKTPMLPALGFSKVVEKHMRKRNLGYDNHQKATSGDLKKPSSGGLRQNNTMSKTISVFNYRPTEQKEDILKSFHMDMYLDRVYRGKPDIQEEAEEHQEYERLQDSSTMSKATASLNKTKGRISEITEVKKEEEDRVSRHDADSEKSDKLDGDSKEQPRREIRVHKKESSIKKDSTFSNNISKIQDNIGSISNKKNTLGLMNQTFDTNRDINTNRDETSVMQLEAQQQESTNDSKLILEDSRLKEESTRKVEIGTSQEQSASLEQCGSKEESLRELSQKTVEVPEHLRHQLNIIQPTSRAADRSGICNSYKSFEKLLQSGAQKMVGNDQVKIVDIKKDAKSRMQNEPNIISTQILFQNLDSLAHDIEAPKRQKLRTNAHNLKFEDMKAASFIAASYRMRSSKEERERLLGKLSAKNQKKQKREAQKVHNLEVQELKNFLEQCVDETYVQEETGNDYQDNTQTS